MFGEAVNNLLFSNTLYHQVATVGYSLKYMVRARKFVRFYFDLELENHAELNTKTTSVVITRAKEQDIVGIFFRHLYTKIK